MKHASRRIRAHAVACVLASAGLVGETHGAVVYSGVVNLSIPANVDGLYLNLVTGVTGPTGAMVPGYDFNVFSTSGVPTTFRLFANPVPATNGFMSTGGTAVGPYRLPEGTPVGAPGATFFRPSGGYDVAPELALDSDNNLLGVSFLNEGTGQVNYAWVRVRVGESAAVRAVVGYAYDNVGGKAIIAGDLRVFSSGFEDVSTP